MNSRFKKGFTIIELMVSTAIFITVIMILVGIFMTTIKRQRASFIAQNLEDNARYMMESVIKEVRMSQIEGIEAGGKKIKICAFNETYDKGVYVEYQFSGFTTLERRQKESNNCDKSGSWKNQAINPAGWEQINSTKVNVDGEFIYSSDSKKQPMATIVMKVTPVGAGANTQKINIQNTVTSRKY